jgi:hypothetical protein
MGLQRRHDLSGLALGASVLALLATSLWVGLRSPRTVTATAPLAASTVWQFGDRCLGESLSHEFTLENPSTRTVTIEKIRSGCSCVKSGLSVESPHATRVPPGGRISIPIDLRLVGEPGERKWVVVLQTDAGEVSLRAEGTVRSQFAVSTPYLDFKDPTPEGVKNLAVKPLRKEGTIDIRAISVDATFFQASQSVTGEGVSLKVAPSDVVPYGDGLTLLRATAHDLTDETLMIPIRWSRSGPLSATPNVIRCNSESPEQLYEVTLSSSRSDSEMTINDIVKPSPEIVVRTFAKAGVLKIEVSRIPIKSIIRYRPLLVTTNHGVLSIPIEFADAEDQNWPGKQEATGRSVIRLNEIMRPVTANGQAGGPLISKGQASSDRHRAH